MPEEETSYPDIHTELYEKHLRLPARAHDVLYELLSTEVGQMLPQYRVQLIDDAVNMLCISYDKRPLEVWMIVHEFLRNCALMAKHEASESEVSHA